MANREDVELKMVDGTILRGWVFPAEERAPGVVMSPGFNCSKDMAGLPVTAMSFQAAGVTALVYDIRGVGASDGSPRSDINPFQEVDDVSDVVTFLLSHASVDRRQGVGVWGTSLGGATTLVAAALDPRIRFVVSVCSALDAPLLGAERAQRVLAKAAKDRESMLKGNEPLYLPVVTADGDNPMGFDLGISSEAVQRLHRGDETNETLLWNGLNRTTVGTYRRMVLWTPLRARPWLGKTPIMFVLGGKDEMFKQDVMLEHFNALPGPKRLYVESTLGHWDLSDSVKHAEISQAQVDLMKDVHAGKMTAVE